MNRKLITIAILLVLATFMVACGASNDIVGKWYFEADGGNGEYVQFNEDGTVTYSDNSNADAYTVDGSALKIFNADGVQSDSGLTIDGDEIKFDNGATILYKVDDPPESVSVSEIVGNWSPVEADFGMEIFEDGTYEREPATSMLTSPIGTDVSSSGEYEIKGTHVIFYSGSKSSNSHYTTLKYSDGKLYSTIDDNLVAYSRS